MEGIILKNVFFTYPGRKKPTLQDINLTVRQGEFILLTGPTGCGKSTLLKLLNGLIPHQSGGKLTGQVIVNGIDTLKTDMRKLTRQVGLVFQNPDDQLFATVVEDEVAFGPENFGLPREEIGRRIQEALRRVKMDDLCQAGTNELSGGQKQRVAIASMMAMQPKVLALDEPISQLDPVGADEVLNVIKELNTFLGTTIILVEHRIHEVAHLADRIIIMNGGQVVLDQPVRQALRDVAVFHRYGLRVPEGVELFADLKLPETPLAVVEAVKKLKNVFTSSKTDRPVRIPPTSGERKRTGEVVVKIQGLRYTYDPSRGEALRGVNLEVREGERVALMGNNGSGKSTLLLHLAAILKPSSGTVEVLGENIRTKDPYFLAGQVGIVFQNPDLMLFCDTVRDEVEFGPRNLKFSSQEIELRRVEALSAMTITDLAEDPPMALSKGQRLRTAVASVLAMQPRLLLLDEPTTGQDKMHIDAMMDFLSKFYSSGTLVFCTHDVETVIKYATRVVVMNEGHIIADGEPRDVFSSPEILTRAALRPPQSLLISQGLGLTPAFTVDELKELLVG